MSYILCHRCATAIDHCDFSAFDFDAPDLADKVQSWAEAVGNIVISPDETDTTAACDACGQGIDEHGHIADPR
ncbi:hypothetical protein GS896_27630 [Rhodococcus hoagii]|nr:hypothetical protein [Prescottella equi]MBM4654024.1 hypothetical protein [Prescottella equi]MBM4719715.1 hypothetical protein [Prescottella equi]NKR23510.1 hypothetical protein [Prescottella equi]NKT56336.1 hypothetical protein [Prescottella equi]